MIIVLILVVVCIVVVCYFIVYLHISGINRIRVSFNSSQLLGG